MSQIKLTPAVTLENPVEGDLAIEGNSLVIWGGDDDTAENRKGAIAQECRSKLRMFRGEWFLDRREGTPYFEEILGKKAPDPQVLKRVFTEVITSVNGIAAVETINVTIDGRACTVDFVAALTDGARLESSEFGAFLVELG